MSLRRLRLGLTAFLALNVLFAANLYVLQPGQRQLASKHIAFPGSAPIETSAVGFEDAPPGQVALATGPTAQPPAAVPSAPVAAASDDTSSSRGTAAEGDLTRAIQRELQAHGYETGGADGVAGLVTRASIMGFEWDNGLALTGEPSQRVLERLLLGGGEGGIAGGSLTVRPGPGAEQVIRTVQQSLTALGYGKLEADGRLGEATQRAIRQFETRQGMPETGRISGQMAARLVRLAAQGRVADSR